MKHVFLITFALIFLQFNSQAQSDSTSSTPHFKHAIGVTAGFTIGNGLSYRQCFDKFEIQGSFAPYKSEETEKYNVGLTFFYKLVESEKVNFYLYQGNEYIYRKEQTYNWVDNNTQEPIIGHSIESYFNNGIGVGIRFFILKRVSLDFMVGYASYENYTKISLTGETGLHFMF